MFLFVEVKGAETLLTGLASATGLNDEDAYQKKSSILVMQVERPHLLFSLIIASR